MADNPGQILRHLRRKLDLRQDELASRASCAQPTVSLLESERHNANPETLTRVYKALRDAVFCHPEGSPIREASGRMLGEWAEAVSIDPAHIGVAVGGRVERRPRVAPDDALIQFARRNEVAKCFHKPFSRAFRKEALPDPFFNPVFDFEDASVYVQRRKWEVDDREQKSFEPLAYERYLDEIFWSDSPEDHQQLVVLSGPPGWGKSTLLQAYLRSYCPNSGRRKNLFKYKVPVFVNFNNVKTAEEFDAYLYGTMRSQLREQCKKLEFDLEASDDYRMFEPRLDVKSKLFEQAIGEDAHFLARQIIELRKSLSDEEWVNLALHYLSSKLTGSTEDEGALGLPIRFVVLCLDNLDNSPLEIQLRALQLCIRWMRQYRSTVWQFYLPLWPSTLRAISQNADLSMIDMNDIVEVPVGQVDEVQFINARLDKHLATIKDDKSSGTLSRSSAGDDMSLDESADFISSTRSFLGKSQIAFVRKLSGGNLRREIDLWQVAFSSKSLLENHLRYRDDPGGQDRFGWYKLADALITGKYPLHNRSASAILNIFYAAERQTSSWDLLVGVHILFALDSCPSEEAIVSDLCALGHDRNVVLGAMEYLRSGYLFEYASLNPPRQIETRTTLTRAYRELLENAAYIDNMAMVTPVEGSRIPKLHVTNSYERDAFPQRVATTLEFLEQVQQDEEGFFAQAGNNAILLKTGIRRVLPGMASAYRERLGILRKRNLIREVSMNWESVFGHPVFEGLDDLDLLAAD